MDIKEILNYCKKEYSPGAIYISLGDRTSQQTVEETDFEISGKDIIWAEPGKGILYKKGKYAKILNKTHSLWI